MKICGIYQVTNPKGKVYIGQSIDCFSRKKTYQTASCKSQERLCNSIKKYGWENHKFEIIHECEESRLNELEIFYIKKFNCFNSETGLNLRSGGANGRPSELTKQRLSKTVKDKNIKASLETKMKMSKARLKEEFCLGRFLKRQLKRKSKKVNKKPKPIRIELLDTTTGIFYDSVVSAQKAKPSISDYRMCRAFRERYFGQNINNTPFIKI